MRRHGKRVEKLMKQREPEDKAASIKEGH